MQEYQSHFVGLFSRLKSEEEYLEVSKRYNLYRNNNVINDVTLSLVADSGFSSINALPLYNFGITDIEEIGNCAGLDYLSMLSFKEDEMLKGTTFSNVSIKYNKEKINSLNLSNYESILNGSAGNFIPSSENFKSIYKDSNLEVKNGSIDKIFLLDNIKNTNDYELLKGILLLQKWASENFSKQTATSFSSFKYYTQESLCPSSELDLIKNELSLGNPVSVTVTTYDGNGHNLIGYQLYQNKTFKDYYYLRVIDTNKISEDDLFVIFYNTNGSLYAIYSPSGLYTKNKYVYAKKIECSTYDGKLLHKTNTRWSWDKDYNSKVLKY